MKICSTLVRARPVRRLGSLAVVYVGGPIGCDGGAGQNFADPGHIAGAFLRCRYSIVTFSFGRLPSGLGQAIGFRSLRG